jgi:hypothetical protein
MFVCRSMACSEGLDEFSSTVLIREVQRCLRMICLHQGVGPGGGQARGVAGRQLEGVAEEEPGTESDAPLRDARVPQLDEGLFTDEEAEDIEFGTLKD